ncbi:RNA polymerase sigma-70 factor [Sinomicrobium sp.]
MKQSRCQLDIELIKGIKRGDRIAFGRLFILMRKKLYFFVLSYTKSGYAADEIVQEVFIRIWQKREKIKPATFYTLIFVMARNLTYNYLRDTMRRETAREELWEAVTKSKSHNQTETQLYYKEYCAIVGDIVNQLPVQKRKIYRLSREQGKSNAEIAAILGITTKTVKNHLWKTMTVIKRGIRPFMEGSL